jgi:hypothetical protein
MRKPSPPPPEVSDKISLDFNCCTALENLRADLMGVEALLHAAEEVVVELPAPSNTKERRVFARLYTLVTKAAEEASTALLSGDEAVATMSAHVEARRKAKPSPSSS